MRWVLAAVLAGVLVAGCGGSGGAKSNGEAGKTPAQILADVKAAVANATSVHVEGSGTSGSGALSLDLRLTKNGGTGHVSLNGLGFDVTRIGSKLYFRGDRKFVTGIAGATAAQLIAGKWFYVSPNVSGFGGFKPLTDMVALTNQILAAPGALAKGGATKIGGQDAIEVKDTSNGGSLFIATTGKAYPLELKAGKGSGSITFTDWDAPVSLSAPKNALDYAKLTRSR